MCNPHYMKISFGFVTQNPYIHAKALKNKTKQNQHKRTPHLLHSNRNSAFLSIAHV